MTELIFEQSTAGRVNNAQSLSTVTCLDDIPDSLLRRKSPALPEVSEMQAVRHYTRLSQLNFSIDTQFYPLGSCTMKHNPRICNEAAMYEGFS
ncbi:MAG: aminomethyl-transferring glycine dehydrogenase subunit GcvPB, partial [Pseudomonadota bacterium]|nr:aminomethyl-transferring glycine dehydrogenase subunit GcvPB [Pseudomonadota bacterium]